MLGDVFGRLVTDRGWTSPVAVGSVLSRWDELVGADIALHCRPESFENEVVAVRCDSTAWATQLKLLTPALLQRFEQALGPVHPAAALGQLAAVEEGEGQPEAEAGGR